MSEEKGSPREIKAETDDTESPCPSVSEVEQLLRTGQVSSTHVDEVWPNLFIGDAATANNRFELWKLGITHVLNAAHGGLYCQGGPDFYGSSVSYLGVPAHDLPDFNISAYFSSAADFIHNALPHTWGQGPSSLCGGGQPISHSGLGLPHAEARADSAAGREFCEATPLDLPQLWFPQAAVPTGQAASGSRESTKGLRGQPLITFRPHLLRRHAHPHFALQKRIGQKKSHQKGDFCLCKARLVWGGGGGLGVSSVFCQDWSLIQDRALPIGGQAGGKMFHKVRDKTPQIEDLQRLLWTQSGPGNHMDEVWPNIYVGDLWAARNLKMLQSQGITHILNAAHGGLGVSTGPSYYRHLPVTYHGIEAFDDPAFDLSVFFHEAANFIQGALEASEGKVLVHCAMGLSRSATLVLAFLMLRKQLTLVEALRTVSVHRNISPNRGFLSQLRDLDLQLSEEQQKGSRERLIPPTSLH